MTLVQRDCFRGGIARNTPCFGAHKPRGSAGYSDSKWHHAQGRRGGRFKGLSSCSRITAACASKIYYLRYFCPLRMILVRGAGRDYIPRTRTPLSSVEDAIVDPSKSANANRSMNRNLPARQCRTRTSWPSRSFYLCY
jgi:hypothetical protein